MLYVTERAVFQLTKEGLLLKEIAPGVDLQKDILEMMDFEPIMNNPLSYFNTNIFKHGKLEL